MSLIKKLLFIFIFTYFFNNFSIAEEVKKIGKFKDWEVMVISGNNKKVCFAQSIPVLQAPKKFERDSRLFVTFRPGEKITDEISITAGYNFNTKNSISAKSGKNKYKFYIVR